MCRCSRSWPGQADWRGSSQTRIRSDKSGDSSLDSTPWTRSLFTAGCQFSVDWILCQDADGDANVRMALTSPERFVLKPQREGGGNNVYGADIRPVLERMQHSRERTAYILMDRL